ncbi:MAG: PucR family transcriptional regulator, partial [Christensenellales bacterium]
RGEIDGAELESLAAAHEIPSELDRCVIYLHARELTSEEMTDKLRPLLEEQDMLTEVGRHSVALVKALSDPHDPDALRTLVSAYDAVFADAQIDSMIGVSEPRALLSELPDAFAEAREAINVGGAYRTSDRVFLYSRLLLERFLDTVSQPSASNFASVIFNAQTSRLFNDEMIHTIEVFFENHLNLSEAARKLYIHRNTLVYRLEKVQRLTGFDLRQFDDAVTFKLMMLLSKNNGARKMRV